MQLLVLFIWITSENINSVYENLPSEFSDKHQMCQKQQSEKIR